jgi:2-phosphoglycerate kinase
MRAHPPWQVFLLGGASGVGKTSISYRLARHYGVGLTEVDDFQVILEGMTTPEQYPVLHFWRTHHEEARRMSDEEHVAFFQQYASIMARALTLVVANHIESRAPVVLEGDFILPSLAIQEEYAGIRAENNVRALFLCEVSETQIARNFERRDGVAQPERARISWLVNAWLRAEAGRLGVPVLAARPWDSTLGRATATVDTGDTPILS